ncbi:MAG: hypothetical protein V3U14_13005 [candidate division NC10 bacterium]
MPNEIHTYGRATYQRDKSAPHRWVRTGPNYASYLLTDPSITAMLDALHPPEPRQFQEGTYRLRDDITVTVIDDGPADEDGEVYIAGIFSYIPAEWIGERCED